MQLKYRITEIQSIKKPQIAIITDCTKKKTWNADRIGLKANSESPHNPKMSVSKIDLSTGLEEEDGHLPQVEIDKMLRLVSHIASEIAADDAVPSGIVFFVELKRKITFISKHHD